nr:hypothetical protein [Tanacetum cinerariifolium]
MCFQGVLHGVILIIGLNNKTTGSNPKVRLTATPNETNQEWWKRLHEYLDESLSAYENVENSKNERGEYADLDKEVSSGADAWESSREETIKEDTHSRRELKLERLLHQVNQELSYAADDLHTMALDEDAKVCTDEPKPSTTLHSFIQVDGVQFMALDEDAKVCIYEEPKPSTTLHSDIPADEVHFIPLDDDAKDTTVVDEAADKQVVDANTIKMIKLKRKRRKKGKIGVISPAVIGDCGEISLTDVTEQQPYTTKPPLVKRHSNRINIEFNQAVIGDVCEKILLTTWIEILKRPAGAPKSKTVVPMEKVEFLRSDGNRKFSFPWVEKNLEVDKPFGVVCWAYIYIIMHLDLWIPYMWRTRPDGAN